MPRNYRGGIGQAQDTGEHIGRHGGCNVTVGQDGVSGEPGV